MSYAECLLEGLVKDFDPWDDVQGKCYWCHVSRWRFAKKGDEGAIRILGGWLVDVQKHADECPFAKALVVVDAAG